jgi:hypothetical protein
MLFRRAIRLRRSLSAAEDAARFFGTPSSSSCSDAAFRADENLRRRLHDQGLPPMWSRDQAELVSPGGDDSFGLAVGTTNLMTGRARPFAPNVQDSRPGSYVPTRVAMVCRRLGGLSRR